MHFEQAERTDIGILTRGDVRERKRTIRLGTRGHASVQQLAQARESAVLLLERSIRLGHRRLALRRLAEAIRIGAHLSAHHWEYGNTVASSLGAEMLDRIIAGAMRSSIE